jgi:hypothetical protein
VGNLLDPLQRLYRTLVHNIAGVKGCRRFEQQEPALLVCDGFVFDPAGDDDEFALLDPFVAVAKFHAEAAFHNQEHLVLVLVMVEDKFPFELVELHLLPVELGGDIRLPVFRDLGEFLGDVHFVHGIRIVRSEKGSQEVFENAHGQVALQIQVTNN